MPQPVTSVLHDPDFLLYRTVAAAIRMPFPIGFPAMPVSAANDLYEPRLRFSPNVREALRGSAAPIVVTGASGWIGLATLEMLREALGTSFGNRVHALASTPKSVHLRDGETVRLSTLRDLASQPLAHGPLVAHYAFLTREKASEQPLPHYIEANRTIIGEVTDFCRRSKAAGLFETSSGAVYGPGRALATDIDANPYGVLKLEEEQAFAALAAEIGARMALCRVFNLSGPYSYKRFAITDLIGNARRGEPLSIGAKHAVFRSFVHVRDVIDVGFAVMTGIVEADASPYDTAGERPVELGDLATRVSAVLGDGHLPVTRGEVEWSRLDYYVGDGRRFRSMAAAAGFEPLALDGQIRVTAASMP